MEFVTETKPIQGGGEGEGFCTPLQVRKEIFVFDEIVIQIRRRGSLLLEDTKKTLSVSEGNLQENPEHSQAQYLRVWIRECD